MTRSNQVTPGVEEQTDELSKIGETLSAPGAVTRRRALIGGGVAAMTAALAACSSSGKSTKTSPSSSAPASTTPASSSSAPATTGASADAAVATLAAGLEVLAVGTYKAALSAATAGKLGTVPPAVAEFVKTAMSQHQTQLDSLNQFLAGAGKPKVTTPNATLKPTVDSAFAKVKDAAGAAELALMLEQIAAQTYLKAIPMLTEKPAIKLAGQIFIIDQQHQAILLYALGMYPVPVTFVGTAKAASK
ncbi:MAG: ferritin-like domain-containing protein [Jatrophihabitans sp.]